MNQRGFDFGLGLTLGPRTGEMTHPGCDLNKFMGILTDYSTPTTKLHDESKGSFGGEVSPPCSLFMEAKPYRRCQLSKSIELRVSYEVNLEICI